MPRIYRVCECGHGWLYHFKYDDELERYVISPCDHHSGCDCELWREKNAEED
jgi:hypothetical protein